MSSAESLPIVIAEFDRNDRERIRVTLDKFNGHNIISVRNFYRNNEGELKPGKGGIGMAVRHLPKLAEALDAALLKARDLGLIQPERQ